MNWKELGGTIADMGADLLGEALPFPGAGAAVDALAAAFGGERDPDRIAEAVKADPKAAAKLREIESEHESALAREISRRQSAVNETIQAGYRQGVLWRRAVGWSLAVVAPAVIIGGLGLGAYAVSTGQPGLIKHIPSVVEATAPVWYVYLTTLGIAGYQEGRLGRALAGDKGGGGGVAAALQALRGSGGKEG
ncbi:hypothetical protein [Halorhodospira neutriphila]|uniref:hypothetical protein n=1 Tax=Halorhodospira neutriphila TaxID=168379 RepID=UPI001907A0D1|nr:hypothetical protein [Halorhodospira neutriphila]